MKKVALNLVSLRQSGPAPSSEEGPATLGPSESTAVASRSQSASRTKRRVNLGLQFQGSFVKVKERGVGASGPKFSNHLGGRLSVFVPIKRPSLSADFGVGYGHRAQREQGLARSNLDLLSPAPTSQSRFFARKEKMDVHGLDLHSGLRWDFVSRGGFRAFAGAEAQLHLNFENRRGEYSPQDPSLAQALESISGRDTITQRHLSFGVMIGASPNLGVAWEFADRYRLDFSYRPRIFGDPVNKVWSVDPALFAVGFSIGLGRAK